MSSAVEIRGLAKRYGRVHALAGVDLAIDSGLYYVLLGPSGGGKTTLLRTIGGFIEPDAGTVHLNGEDMTGVPPERRPTSMVFQSYALFPHMNVARNVGYGLELRKLPAPEIAARVAAALEQVSLAGFGERRVWELSGGQQQRVQLARALVLEPAILLLDEPLAALDAKLRKEMCYELKRLQAEVGITFVHVTHNQEEALTVADRIALVADGELVEEGTPREIYESPRRRFTAGFIGENNLLQGKVAALDGEMATVTTAAGPVPVAAAAGSVSVGDAVSVSIRSERVHVASEGLPATCEGTVYLGLLTQVLFRLDDGTEMMLRAPTAGEAVEGLASGARVHLAWQPSDARLHLD